jgi:hypothetical protein
VDFTGLSEAWQFREHPRQHGFVTLTVMRGTERAADWMIDKDRPRRWDLTHNIERRTRE